MGLAEKSEVYIIEAKAKKQKSWQEKLEDSKGLPKVDEIMRRVGHVIKYRKDKKEAIVRDFEKYLVKM